LAIFRFFNYFPGRFILEELPIFLIFWRFLIQKFQIVLCGVRRDASVDYAAVRKAGRRRRATGRGVSGRARPSHYQRRRNRLLQGSKNVPAFLSIFLNFSIFLRFSALLSFSILLNFSTLLGVSILLIFCSKGEAIEKTTLLNRYCEMANHVVEIISRRIGFAIAEGFFLKYVSRSGNGGFLGKHL
jgi:hypothetical protein